MEKLINRQSVLEVAKGFVFTDKTQKRQYMDFLKYCLDNANDNSEPLTNANHIRNMTDEQLAHYLEGFAYGGMKVDANKILKYLKSEVRCE